MQSVPGYHVVAPRHEICVNWQIIRLARRRRGKHPVSHVPNGLPMGDSPGDVAGCARPRTVSKATAASKYPILNINQINATHPIAAHAK
jgi:hypothetical protein